MVKYHYVNKQNQADGPVLPEEFATHGITANTMVYCEGMSGWTPAGQVAELKYLFAAPEPAEAATSAAECVATDMTSPGKRPGNGLAFAILNTIFCCWPFGIVSIVFAAKVNGAWDSGRYDEARRAARKSKIFSWISVGLGLLFWIVYAVVVLLPMIYLTMNSIDDYDYDDYSKYDYYSEPVPPIAYDTVAVNVDTVVSDAIAIDTLAEIGEVYCIDDCDYVEETVEERRGAEDERIFTAVEQMPQFPGGDAALMKYIADNIKYPTMAMENNIQGRVVVQFVVTKTGKIGEVKVVRSKGPDLDKEAVRIVKTLPDFIPGKINGQVVNVWYTLPITFRLAE